MRLNKKEYIEKFGADAWKVESVRRRSKRNKERDAEYDANRKGKRNDYFKERRKELVGTKDGRAKMILKAYNRDDKNRGFDISGNIDHTWIVDRIFTSSCTYCGESDWKNLGADRVDDTQPHTPENCICSCGACNVLRNNKSMTVSEFKDYIQNRTQ